MSVKDNFQIGKYTVVVFNNKIPHCSNDKVKVDNDVYDFIIPYDIENAIAIIGNIEYAGQKISFL